MCTRHLCTVSDEQRKQSLTALELSARGSGALVASPILPKIVTDISQKNYQQGKKQGILMVVI